MFSVDDRNLARAGGGIEALASSIFDGPANAPRLNSLEEARLVERFDQRMSGWRFLGIQRDGRGGGAARVASATTESVPHRLLRVGRESEPLSRTVAEDLPVNFKYRLPRRHVGSMPKAGSPALHPPRRD